MSTDDTPRQRRKLSAILMIDVSGFSRLMGRNEEVATHLIRAFHTRSRSVVETHDGRVVDTAGDSVFAEFDSVVNAVRCAQAIQQEQALANAERQPEERIDMRIGVHIGDVIVEEYRLYGDGVNIAARLEAMAQPGDIYVSEAVYQQVHNKLDLNFEDLGIQALRNIEHPIRVYRAGPQTHASPPSSMQEPKPDQQPDRSAKSCWKEEFQRQKNLIGLIIAVSLIASPLFLHPTAGVFSTAGAILAGTLIGRIWSKCTHRPGNTLIAVGGGIMLGAWFTNWSHVTGAIFIIVGLVFVAKGISKNSASSSHKGDATSQR